MKFIFAILLLTLPGCEAFSPEKPAPQLISCDQASIDRQIIVASKAGCKRYTIEKDEMFQTCKFSCYESR